MGVARPLVKRRAYNASGRRAAAAERQAAVIAAAERRFLSEGYGAATIAAVAADAGVSVDTIYKSFGGKPGLVRALWQKALEGVGPVAAERRSDRLQKEQPNPHKMIQGWGTFTAEVAPRAARILMLIHAAAATDPEIRALQEELDAGRLRRMTINARRLRARGHVRAGITLAQATDVLWTYSSPELCELLVFRRGWSPERYGRFIAEAMIAALL